MKIILTQEVAGLGSAGDVVEVKDGHGRNFLLPQGVAIRWSKGAQADVESIKAARTKRGARDVAHAGELKAALEANPVRVKARAGEDGRLFGAVTVADVAEAVAAATGQAIDKRAIAIAAPIKALGAHEVAVKLHDSVSATVALNVVKA